MLNLIKSLLITTIIGIFIFLTATLAARAGEFNLVELDSVKIQYKDFFDGGSDPLITQNGLLNKTLGKEVNLIIDTTLLDYLFFNNTVHSMVDENLDGSPGQFRTVSWGYQLGVRLTTFLDISYVHRSEHLLDYTWPYGHFPLQNSIMFEIKLYEKRKRETLINL